MSALDVDNTSTIFQSLSPIQYANNNDSDQVLKFTSELTGLSIDRLIEKLNELNQKENDNDSCNM